MDFNFMNKEDRENVKKLNKIMNTNYRTKPFDLKKPGDLIEAAKMITAEYVDFAYYWSIISNVEEQFDESLETFKPNAWVKIGLKGTTEEDIFDQAIFNLRETSSIFYDILQRSEEKCSVIWIFILMNSLEEVHKHFFKEVVDYSDEVINKTLKDDIFEIYTQINYDGIVENSVKGFVLCLLQMLEYNSNL